MAAFVPDRCDGAVLRLLNQETVAEPVVSEGCVEVVDAAGEHVAARPHAHCDPVCVAVLEAIFATVREPCANAGVIMHLIGLALEHAQAGPRVGHAVVHDDLARPVLELVERVVGSGRVRVCACALDRAPSLACLALGVAERARVTANLTYALRLPLLADRDRDIGYRRDQGAMNVPYVVNFAALHVIATLVLRRESFSGAHPRPHGVAIKIPTETLTAQASAVRREVRPVVDNSCWLWYARAMTRMPTHVTAAATHFYAERLCLGLAQRAAAALFLTVADLCQVPVDRAECEAFLCGASALIAVRVRDLHEAMSRFKQVPAGAARAAQFCDWVESFADEGSALQRAEMLESVDVDVEGSAWGCRDLATPGYAALFFGAARGLHRRARAARGLPADLDGEDAELRERGFDAAAVVPFVCNVLLEDLLAAVPGCPEALVALEAMWTTRFDPILRAGVSLSQFLSGETAQPGLLCDTRFLPELADVRRCASLSHILHLGVPEATTYVVEKFRRAHSTQPET
jgi:hypothetical protein